MRMWLCDPKIMCQKHLCGEHVEMHMFLGTIKKGKKIDGYLKNNLLEPMALYWRHKQLELEMIDRGYNHNSEMFDVPNTVLNISEEKIVKDKDYIHLAPENFVPEKQNAQKVTTIQTNTERVRVSAVVLDELVNYAGEVSIYRTRLDQ